MNKINYFLENFMQWNGKIFSWLFPTIAFIMAIGLGWRIFYVPDWSGRALFFFLALICLFLGIYLLIKRKNLN